MTYMGYTLTAEGISPTEDKVEAINSAPMPDNATQVRFIPNLSTIVYALNQLL